MDFKVTRNIGVITLNNPEKKNAYSGKMLVELHDLVTDLKASRSNYLVKGIILTGNGDIFCSGGDLKSLHVYFHVNFKSPGSGIQRPGTG